MANNVNVVNRGFEYICQWANGGNPGSTVWPQPKFIGWGTANGSNATSVQLPASAPAAYPPGPSTAGTGQWSDIAPFQEAAEARVTGTNTVTNNTVASSFSTYQLTGTITSGSAQSIGESFITMSATKQYETTLNGTLPTSNTSMTVTTNWPAVSTPFYLQIDNEVIQVSATSSTLIASTIVRAQNGSSVVGHSTGTAVNLGNPPGVGGSNPNNGDLFAHAGFQALALNNGDSIAFTWQINVTS